MPLGTWRMQECSYFPEVDTTKAKLRAETGGAHVAVCGGHGERSES